MDLQRRLQPAVVGALTWQETTKRRPGKAGHRHVGLKRTRLRLSVSIEAKHGSVRDDDSVSGYSVRRAVAVRELAAQDAGASAPAIAMARPARASSTISGSEYTDIRFGG
jgi:hypothetical protein